MQKRTQKNEEEKLKDTFLLIGDPTQKRLDFISKLYVFRFRIQFQIIYPIDQIQFNDNLQISP